MKLIILSVILLNLLVADEVSKSYLIKKGKNIASRLCNSRLLPKGVTDKSIEDIIEEIKASKACIPLNKKRLEALALFLKSGSKGGKSFFKVPKGAKCPVCGMFVYKYPKWASKMVVGSKSYYFDGVKDMMKFYIFDGDFPFNRADIKEILVRDFYTLESIPAKEAYYVVGSKVYGPMGNELIPFKSKKEAKDFINDHGGDKIIRFNQIDAKLVMSLDGIEYKEK